MLRIETMRYRLRTLLIVLALGPPIIWAGWLGYGEWHESMVHLEMDENERGQVIRVVQRPSGRVLAEFEVEHVSIAPKDSATDNRP
jgi:hypothetical protein